MYKINNKGPSTEPCGTPLNTFLQLEYFTLILTRWYLFDKKDSIHDSTLPAIPALRSFGRVFHEYFTSREPSPRNTREILPCE